MLARDITDKKLIVEWASVSAACLIDCRGVATVALTAKRFKLFTSNVNTRRDEGNRDCIHNLSRNPTLFCHTVEI